MKNKQDIKVIFLLMKRLGISLNELILYDKPIEITKKFPLPVYFSDGTQSSDVEHYYGKGRHAIGVVIGRTVYALREECMVSCEEISRVCKSWNNEFFRQNSCLPTQKQVAALMEHITDYNKIRLFFGYYAFWFPGAAPVNIAVKDERNCECFQYSYNVKSRNVYGSNGCVEVLPVVNL